MGKGIRRSGKLPSRMAREATISVVDYRSIFFTIGREASSFVSLAWRVAGKTQDGKKLLLSLRLSLSSAVFPFVDSTISFSIIPYYSLQRLAILPVAFHVRPRVSNYFINLLYEPYIFYLISCISNLFAYLNDEIYWSVLLIYQWLVL